MKPVLPCAFAAIALSACESPPQPLTKPGVVHRTASQAAGAGGSAGGAGVRFDASGSGSPFDDDDYDRTWNHPEHHSTRFTNKYDINSGASHRTSPDYRDPHHGGSRHGHDEAGHRIDSHGHHVDSSGNHTRTPDVISKVPEITLESGPASFEPSRTSDSGPAHATAEPPPASSPSPASTSSESKTESPKDDDDDKKPKS